MDGRRTYRNRAEISTGERFRVFRAERADDGRRVVLKAVRADRREPRNEELLRHEWKLLLGFDHPWVARPLALEELDDGPVLVLEDAGPRNVYELLEGGPLAVPRFLELAISMAEVVAEVHRQGIIHRDICPSNFVLRDRATLVDFEAATATPAFTQAPGPPGELEGTLAYVAPEQIGRMNRRVDHRADLYALGATFYEMLTGAPPFPSRDPLELLHAHAARRPPTPAVVNGAVPGTLSNIVVKLLSKMPEWRYQSADALKIDLEEARRRWRSTGGEIPSFELGLHDVPYGLLIGGNLYGRERAQETLLRILERVSTGPAEVVLVTGPAGIGKTSLLHYARARAGAECRWLEGKGDLLTGNVPHAPVLEAFRGLLREQLRQPAEQMAGLRERLRAEVAPNGRVLTDRLPELEQLIGEQPALADVGPVEAENRFEHAFVALVRALTGDGRRHVLFVDDLQWADPASTKLVTALAIEPGLRSLLIVGAYRTEELAADHPLWAAARRIRDAGTPLTMLELESLEPASVIALLCEALRVEPDEAAPLAETIGKKTAGNPFFVRQFLGHLYRSGLLVYDPGSGRWSWETARIEGAQIGENVVELLSRNIGRLPAREQDVLETAACVGNEFGLGLLAAVRGETLEEVARALWAPVQQGLLVPVGGGPRFSWAGGRPVELGTAHAPAYRFAHDRLQEAAYRLIGEERRKELHLRIGRWLLAHAPPAAYEDAICSIVDQLDRAVERLDGEERLRLAALNHHAGRLARAATAWASALGYYTAGLELLPAEPWGASSRELWFAMVRDAAECAALTGEHALCERLAQGALPRTERRLEKAALWHVLAQSSALRGDHAVSIQRSAEGLRLLGVDLPGEVSERALEVERASTREALRWRSDRNLLEAPAMEDEEERARLRLLVGLAAATWFKAPRLFEVVCRRAVALTASQGVAADSAFAFAAYAIALAMDGEYEDAHRFGRLGAALAERSSNAAQECRALMVLGGHVSPWRAPLRDAVPLLRRAYARGLESGELEYAAYAAANLLFALWSLGASLDGVLAEADSAVAFYRRIGHLGGIPYVAPFTQAARCLKGLTRDHASFDDAGFDESRFLLDAAGNGLGFAVYHLLRLQTCFLLDEPARALEHARRGERWLPHLRTIFLQADHFLYAALALSSLHDAAPAAAKDGLLSELRAHHRRLDRWARESPATFGHKCDLVAAEIARIERRPETAALYDRAVARASGEGFVHEAALAHERCARFLAEQGEREASELHHRAAVEGYAAWGAAAKVALLAKVRPPVSTSVRGAPASSGGAHSLQTLELRILMQAAEALSSELDLERLLRKLMRTAVEAASAERAALVLAEPDPSVRAVATAHGEVALHDVPLSESAAVPGSVVEHVLRSGAVLVMKDALADDRFARDPYVARNGVRSVMAVPLRRQDRTVGILYFENDLATDAFTPERVEVFRLLSAQMAVALENSLLFAERRRAEEALNLLAHASGELSESLDYEHVLATVGNLAVPALADWCIVDVLEGRDLVSAEQRHTDPSKQSLLENLRRLAPVDVDSPQPQAQAIRSREPLLVPDVTADFIRAGVRDEEHLRLVQALDPRSLIVVPLVARGRAIGVLTLVRSRPERRYGEPDLSVAQQFARRAALAVENARLHRALQEAMRLRTERDRHLRMIFRQVPGAIWAADRSLRLTHTAGNVPGAPDLDPRKLLGSSIQEFVGTRDPTDPGIAHHLAALAGEPQSFEYQYRDRWYEVLIEPLRDAEQAIMGCVGAAFDVTERRANAERLALSEARFAEAQRVAHIGSFEWDAARNVVTWSDELHRIYGLEPGQFTGRFESFLERVHPEDLELTRTVVFDAYREVKPFVYDHRVVRADGSVRMLHTRGDVVADEHGKPIRIVGSCWDVTELKESIRKLEHAVSRWEATLDATAEGILVVDLEGNISAVNHRFLSLWRIPAERAHARKHLDMLAPVLEQVEDPRAFLERVRGIYAGPAQESFDVVRFKDGRVFERQSAPQHIGEEIVGRVWSLRDVTERERLLRRALLLADATRLLASLDVEPALDSVAHLAVPSLGDGCAIDLLAEGGPRRLLAVSRDPTRPINPELHPSVVAGHPTLYSLGARSYMAVPLLVKGALVGAMTFVAPPSRRYTDDDLELAEELGRRAALSVENARLYRGAQDALGARDEFLSIAAHEIRGPVTSMHLAVQGLQRGKIPPAAMARVLDVIEREDRRLARFVDELLDLGRLRGGRLHLKYEQVDLADVVREATARLAAELAESGSSLSIATEGRTVGRWDRFRLDQVVTNLLSNAIKFGLGKPIAVSAKAERGIVLLMVKDQGIGISPEVHERIFLPFERAVAVRHYGGLGLGLFIARTVVQELGGRLSVESSPSAGSIFTVELPQARVR